MYVLWPHFHHCHHTHVIERQKDIYRERTRELKEQSRPRARCLAFNYKKLIYQNINCCLRHIRRTVARWLTTDNLSPISRAWPSRPPPNLLLVVLTGLNFEPTVWSAVSLFKNKGVCGYRHVLRQHCFGSATEPPCLKSLNHVHMYSTRDAVRQRSRDM